MHSMPQHRCRNGDRGGGGGGHAAVSIAPSRISGLTVETS